MKTVIKVLVLAIVLAAVTIGVSQLLSKFIFN